MYVHKSKDEPVRRFEVFTGDGRRREWSDDQKARIIEENCELGVTVCPVARRHGLTPQQLFTWRRLARKPAEVLSVPRENPMFAPAVVVSPEKPEPKKARPARSPRKNSFWPPQKRVRHRCVMSGGRPRHDAIGPQLAVGILETSTKKGSAARAAFTGADREYRNADRCSRIRRYPYLPGGAFLRVGDRGNRSGVQKLGD
ncbi:transposase [Rhizobium ruizarguesonis]|uniref:Transposase n=1 Tax=Rhizobium ruizarguesonis TaxID=2081791 RepID=A0ABY1WW17_9HYPH|nr:transposase [Rhizobium ruizarguesonis]TAU57037.1 transposase [Rhizobium ruizarguesonis]TAV19038.1 transposase [Rhizobium ruizarguesonis]TAW01881.1 transposase [Rhizobium ruizarguesonis]TAW47954.1 transposase [Rhizobium ruizarguesonis]